MSRLIAGPWVGEFGWELFLWQGYVRSLSKYFKETICIGRDSSHYLYKDFCTKYIAFNKRTGSSNMWLMNNFDLDKFDFDDVVESYRYNLPILKKYWEERTIKICNRICGSNRANKTVEYKNGS